MEDQGGDEKAQSRPEKREGLCGHDGLGGGQGPARAAQLGGGGGGIGPDDQPGDGEDGGQPVGEVGPAATGGGGEAMGGVEPEGRQDAPGKLEEVDELVGVADDGEARQQGHQTVEGGELAEGQKQRREA